MQKKHFERPAAQSMPGRLSRKGTGTPVVVEVVDLVPGSIPERVQYASMEDWRMDCLWWLGLTVKRSASLLSMYHASNDCTIEIEGP